MFRVQALQHRPLEPPDNLVQPAFQGKIPQGLAHAIVRQPDMLSLDHPALTEGNRLEQHVLQLPDIARPVIVRKAIHRRRRQLRQWTTDLPAGLVEKMLHQRGQPVQALTQGRDMQGQHVEPVIEILAKFAPRTQFREVDLGRADHPHIQVHLLVAADPTEAAVLEKTQ